MIYDVIKGHINKRNSSGILDSLSLKNEVDQVLINDSILWSLLFDKAGVIAEENNFLKKCLSRRTDSKDRNKASKLLTLYVYLCIKEEYEHRGSDDHIFRYVIHSLDDISFNDYLLCLTISESESVTEPKQDKL